MQYSSIIYPVGLKSRVIQGCGTSWPSDAAKEIMRNIVSGYKQEANKRILTMATAPGGYTVFRLQTYLVRRTAIIVSP